MSADDWALHPSNAAVATLFADAMDRAAIQLAAAGGPHGVLAKRAQQAANASRAMASEAETLAALDPDDDKTAEDVRTEVQQTRGFGAAIDADPLARQEFIDSLTREQMDDAPEAYRAYVAGYFAGARFAEAYGTDE